MYKVTKRDCPMFGIGPYVCEFICDTASDIATLPTSISEGTGGKTAYDNQKCASGSIANIAENGAESKQYMLNNQDIWCPYSVASGSSESVLEEAKAYTDSEIADLINGAPTTLDTLKEISDAMVENQTVAEALDAAIGTKANKTDIPTKVSQLENDSGYLTEHPHINEKPGPTTITSLRFGDSFDSVEQIVTDGNGHIQEVHNQTLTLPNILIENSLDIHSSGLLTNKTITAALNEKADTTHTHSVDEIGADSRGSAAAALSEAKTYTDNAVADLINGAPTTRDTLKEISDLMDENASVVEALDAAIGSKANKTDIPTKTSELENDSGFLTEHQDLSEYAKSTDVNAALGNKADISHTHDTYASKSLYSDTTINTGRKAGTTVGVNSTAEGTNTTSSSHSTHAEGIRTTASGGRAHAEGCETTASGNDSHAEGCETTASGHQSHAEGYVATASGDVSHAEGMITTASGSNSHAEGYKTTASGIASHAGGTGTKALHDNEVAYGKYNESKDDTLFSVGDGTADDARHNAFEITTSGGKLHDKDIATTDLIPIIKSINFSADTTDGYIWTGIPFPKYVIGVDLGHFDVIAQFYKGNHADAGRAEWAMKFFNMNDVTTPLNGSFNGTIYYIG